jgi:hypothetical protein
LDERLYPREYAQYRSVLASTAAQRGIPLITARRLDVGLSDADFSDLIHLNATGAARFSAWLRAAIEDSRALGFAHGGAP